MISYRADCVAALRDGQQIATEQAEALCESLLDAEFDEQEAAEILVLLAQKGETAEEVCGFARALLRHAAPVPFAGAVVDTCGTGGSGLVRFNTSTAVAFVSAAAGVRVAKHGNRGSRRPNGSFDLLEALGVPVELDGAHVAECLAEVGLGFLLAPRFHPVMKRVAASAA
jgi:anthranilate phosphoribosyltransferase